MPASVDQYCKNILRMLTHNEQKSHKKEYKLFGGYWELVLPLLEKHAPVELKQYAIECDDSFEYRNPTVKAFLDDEDDLVNLQNAINYFNHRQKYSSTDEYHYITIGDKDIAYIPNEPVDQDMHFGKENAEEM